MIGNTGTAFQFPGNNSANQFGFPNKVFAASDLVVTQGLPGGTPALLQLGVDYTVQNVDVDTGCTVTTTVPVPFGFTLDVRTVTSLVQGTSIKNQGSFLPELHEEAFDRITRELQDVYRRTYTYGLHGPDSEIIPWATLPPPSARLGQQLIFDPVNGLPVCGAPTTVTTLTQSLLAGLLNPPTLGEIAAGVTITAPWYAFGIMQRYGVKADGVTDDTAAINAIGGANWNSNVTLSLGAGSNAIISNTVTFKAPYAALNMNSGAMMTYTGPADRAAIVLGTDASTFASRDFNVSVQYGSNANTYASSNCVGVQMRGAWAGNRVRLNSALGFTINWQIWGTSAAGVAYNTFDLGISANSQFHLNLQSVDPNGFINENLFLNGDFQTYSSYVPGPSGSVFGIKFGNEIGGYTGNNKNHFLKPCFQLAQPGVTADRIPFLFNNNGTNNQVQNMRCEGVNGELVRVLSGTVGPIGNTIDIGYATGGSGTITAYMTESDGGFSYGNRITRQGIPLAERYYSGDLMQRAFAPAANNICVTGMFMQSSGSGTETATGVGKIGKDYVFPTNALGVYIDTSYYKNFDLRSDIIAARPGRIVFTGYTAAGAQVTGTRKIMFAGLAENAAYGGHSYTQASDVNGLCSFRVDSDVAYIKLMFAAGTNPCAIRSFTLTAYASLAESNAQNNGLSVYGGVASNPQMIGTTIPNALGWSYSPQGMRIGNGNAMSGGTTPAGWICKTPGYNPVAWGATTFFSQNRIVSNGGNVYVAASDGTSAGSGGPTGTGAGIVDGGSGLTWNYVGAAIAVWIADGVNLA